MRHGREALVIIGHISENLVGRDMVEAEECSARFVETAPVIEHRFKKVERANDVRFNKHGG